MEGGGLYKLRLGFCQIVYMKCRDGKRSNAGFFFNPALLLLHYWTIRLKNSFKCMQNKCMNLLAYTLAEQHHADRNGTGTTIRQCKECNKLT